MAARVQQWKKFRTWGVPLGGLFLLWFAWPQLSLLLYRLNGLNQHSAPALGQFGDLFGGLTSLFTLGALVFSIYVNYLQYQQFKELRYQEKLNNHRFVNSILMDDSVMDAASMIQYDKFNYRGEKLSHGSKSGEYYFNDLRLPRDKRDANSSETERKIDKLLMTYEQILVLIENGMLDESIAVSYNEKINIALRQKGIQDYLGNLIRYYDNVAEAPYMRLLLKMNLRQREEERQRMDSTQRA